MEKDQAVVKITRFWDWFRQNEYRFKDVEDVGEVVDALDNQILEFGLFAWEIREGTRRPYRLTISPNSDRRRLELSRLIVDMAPDLADWEFFYCKPPLPWDFRLEMYDSFMVIQSVDVSDWSFVLLPQPEQKADILILPTNMATFDEEDKRIAADLALTHILGEEDKITYIASIRVVPFFAPEHEPLQAGMRELKFQFDQLFES